MVLLMSEPNRIKQVIVMRHDLGMRRGKQIAQGSHASMAFLTRRLNFDTKLSKLGNPKQKVSYVDVSEVEQEWLDSSFAKVCVRVNSEEELMEIRDKAKEVGLEVHLITDSGKTEFHGEPTNTCLAIGPDYSDKIDPITGDLKLL